MGSCLLLSAALGCASAEPPTRGGPDGDGAGDGIGADGSGDGAGADGSGDGTTVPDGSGGNTLGCNKMDIVFVIDNSGSMGEEQQGLVENFPQMVQVLDAFKGGSLDYRLAVTTTAFSDALFEALGIDDAAEGAFLPPAGMDRPWLESSDPDLAAKFTALASVGTSGSGQEQPLQAALSSVTERIDDMSNQMFQREDALLAFVIITDEDDNSGEAALPIPGFPLGVTLRPVEQIVSGLDAATGDRSRWAAAVIAGASDCESNFGEANEASRLKDFVAQTGANATFGDICTGDLSGALQTALNTFTIACNEFDVF